MFVKEKKRRKAWYTPEEWEENTLEEVMSEDSE